VTQAREAAQKNDQLNEERAELMREREQMDNALANARKQLAGLVEPIAPDAASVRIEPYEDHRTMVLGGSMVGIVVVFGAMILLSLQNQKPTTPSPVGGKASRNGNGAAAEEEDEAAVMA